MADNILRRAIVADDSDDNPHAREWRQSPEAWRPDMDEGIKAVREYNDMVVGSERLETFLLPLYDGLSVARLLD